MSPKPYIADIENQVVVTHNIENIDIENIEPSNHIEPNSLQSHIETALLTILLILVYVDGLWLPYPLVILVSLFL